MKTLAMLDRLNQELVKAGRESNFEKVLKMIAAGADIESHNDDGFTSLHRAAGFGFADVVKDLIDLGANLDAKDCNGRTPLELAIEFVREYGDDRSEVIELLRAETESRKLSIGKPNKKVMSL